MDLGRRGSIIGGAIAGVYEDIVRKPLGPKIPILPTRPGAAETIIKPAIVKPTTVPVEAIQEKPLMGSGFGYSSDNA